MYNRIKLKKVKEEKISRKNASVEEKIRSFKAMTERQDRIQLPQLDAEKPKILPRKQEPE